VTPEQTGRVLQYIAAADRRTIGKTDLLVWHDAVGDLQFDDVMDAVRRHYRDSIVFLMPAHIRQAVRKARNDRAGRAVPAAPPPEITDQPDVYKLHLVRAIAEIADRRDIRRALPAPGDKNGPGEEYLALPAAQLASENAARKGAERYVVECPVAWCAADAEQPCRDRDGNRLPWQRAHSQRVIASRDGRGARMGLARPQEAVG
ncbi:hypothetical protein JYK22_40745, partial [Nonomuraea sp. RK-328]|nr:hypothetical protein [Nonomuraea sp. RK-328]